MEERRPADGTKTARTPEALAGSLADIEAAGAEGLVLETDVSDRSQSNV